MRARLTYAMLMLLGLFVVSPVGAQETGTITGKVTVKGSGQVLDGAAVRIATTLEELEKEGAKLKGDFTGQTGKFTIKNVAPGKYKIKATLIGYEDLVKDVTVEAGKKVEVDFELETKPLTMDAVVVTGSVTETKLREVPQAMTVITAEQIEKKDVQDMNSLLRGMVPGMSVFGAGQHGYVGYYQIRGMSTFSGNSVKFFIDGVEVYSDYYIQMLDPSQIEKIEVVRGPQAAAIYGSGATNGVVQIFTKKGRDTGLDRPRIDIRSSFGLIQSESHREGTYPNQMNHNLTLSGGSANFSYNMTLGYDRAVGWLRDYANLNRSAQAGARVVHGPFILETSMRMGYLKYEYGFEPFYEQFGFIYQDRYDNPYNERSQTWSSTLKLQPFDWWQADFTIGRDENAWKYYSRYYYYPQYYGNGYYYYNYAGWKTSYRYNSTMTWALSEALKGDLIVGGNSWSQGYSYIYCIGNRYNDRGCSQAPTATYYYGYQYSYPNQPGSGGQFVQSKIAYNDFALTSSFRIEDNVGLDHRAGAPRVGISYWRYFEFPVVGEVETKFRGQWGKAIKAPPEYAKEGYYYPQYNYEYLPNPDIKPEEQRGVEGGIDMIFAGGLAEFKVTYYNQNADNLIYINYVDITGNPRQYQYINIGRIHNYGWELEGMLTTGPIQLTGNFSLVNSVLAEFSATYAQFFYWLHEGQQMDYTPRKLAGFTATYNLGRGAVTLEGNVQAEFNGIDYTSFYNGLYLTGESRSGYYRLSGLYNQPLPAKWDFRLRADQALSDKMSAFLTINNLTNNTKQSRYDLYTTQGRTSTVGLRLSF